MTTVEKMRYIKTLMDEVQSEVLETAKTIEHVDGPLYRMLTEGCSDIFKHMSKNYHSPSSGNQIDSWEKQLNRAYDLDSGFGKCRCGETSERLHTCPFAEEINGDSETLCNCCSECEHQCAMDI